MADLIKVGNRVINIDQMTDAKFWDSRDTVTSKFGIRFACGDDQPDKIEQLPVLSIITVGDRDVIHLFGDDASAVWDMLTNMSHDICAKE